MKKGVLVLIKMIVIVSLCFIGIYSVHFMFVLGVDASKEKALLRQCEAYSKINEVELIETMNAFTYNENPENVVCIIKDLYEKLVFISPELEVLEYRNARSYQPLEVFDSSDKNQSLTLALHQDQPVYVYKKISRDRIYVAYYSFDSRTLLFEINSEE